jgi:F-type H+-transporting ATPase subunit epsilon
MSTLTLLLLDGKSSVCIDGLASIVAQDASGQFGLLPGHQALLTLLEPGLFRFRRPGQADWTFGACVGGMLHATRRDGQIEVRVVSRRFLLDAEPEALQMRLDEILQSEQTLRQRSHENRAQLDIAFRKRIQQLSEMPA